MIIKIERTARNLFGKTRSPARGELTPQREKVCSHFFSLRVFPKRFLAVLSILVFTGCSMKSIALKATVSLLEKGPEAVYEERDVEFAQSSILNQLKLLETLHKNDPRNPKLSLMLAQGFGAYAFLFLEDQDPERSKIFYERGLRYGLTILDKKCSISMLTESDLNLFEEKIRKLSKKEVPLLFWTTYCWGGLINVSRDSARALAAIPKVERLMLKVEELAPGYFYGGPDLFFGAYYGARSKTLGGDSEKSKFHFERALISSRRQFLIAQVLYARTYAVTQQDRGLYQNLLEEVELFSAEQFPEQRLSNEIAKIKAKKMLEEIDEKF